MKGNLGIAGSIASIISLILGFSGGYFYSLSQSVSQTQQVQIILQEAISDLPEQKRKFAEGVVDSFGGILKATDGSASEMRVAAHNFRERISEAALLSYDVVSSPFPLIQQRTVLLCDGAFSVAYQRDSGINDSQVFNINGITRVELPGSVFNISDKNKKLQLRYMEYIKAEQIAIMSFVCG